MTSGKQSFKNRESVQGYIEAEEKEAFEKIRWREHKTESELLREALQEYIKNHGDGNSTFKLDDFQDPEFKAMPATMSPKEKWSNYIRNHMTREERDELDARVKFVREEIDAKNWLDSRK